ncbi:MAG TPA: cyclic nucleotide-binding domain-containing protein [Terracidiphilus sp.]|nr:cyclic nucleotide-binding domain-containing protein [Terracidiphilus sp.]
MHLDPSGFVAGQELIQALEKHASAVPCDREHTLFRQGDEATGVYILHSGSATLTMHSDSGEVVLRIESGPGSLLGLPGLIGNEPYSLTAVAHAGSLVGFVPRDQFLHLMEHNPALSFKVLQVLAAEVRTARQAIFS